tara:strand:+ start:7212 stop:7631 length:420 start_codon:yes stop_codon:yes gene_type:complete
MSNKKNADKFSVELDKVFDQLKNNTQNFKRTFALNILSRIVYRTPVDTGRARANWQVSNVTANTNERKRFKKNQPEAVATDTIARGQKNIDKNKEGQSIFIANNLPYIQRLESGTWSKQAPQGMVAISIEEEETAIGLR